jgi:hypothetical protein
MRFHLPWPTVRAGLLAAVTTVAVGATGASAGAAEPFAIQGFGGSLVDPHTGERTLQAGGHPDLRLKFRLPARDRGGVFEPVPQERLKYAGMKLPDGFVGNPAGIPTCDRERLGARQEGNRPDCPIESQVGVAGIEFTVTEGIQEVVPIYNLTRDGSAPAEFGFNFVGAVVIMRAAVGTNDYRITVASNNISQAKTLFGLDITMWGVPTDPVHDPLRWDPLAADGSGYWDAKTPNSSPPFLTAPTSCTSDPLEFEMIATTWENPSVTLNPRFTSGLDGRPIIMEGCEKLAFAPSLSAKLTTSTADAPSGLSVDLDVPQNLDRGGLATAHVKDVLVRLPVGTSVSPSSAVGLQACTDAGFAKRENTQARCPEASRIGTVEVESPVLDTPLKGDVFLGTQQSSDPMSGRMFRLFVAAQGSGIHLKLEGAVKADPVTGQVTTLFAANPQMPFSNLKMKLFSGPGAALATPERCGTHAIESTVTSWSGKSVSSSSSLKIDCRAGLGAFAPVFSAGAVNPIAGAFTPFGVSVSRPDGHSALSGLKVVMPEGVMANISNNLGTRVGSVTALAGPGVAPYPLRGSVFLEGPYGDAPFSLRVVVPAKAGPFDLGDVVVRQKVYVDRATARVTVVSDPIPTIVAGVPVRMQRLDVDIDKPGFMINPTSCAAKQVQATLGAISGATAQQSVRFQVGDCASLAFAPRLALSVGTKAKAASKVKAVSKAKVKARKAATASGPAELRDGGHPALTAHLEMDPNSANNQKATVTLPKALALDPDNANALCEPVDAAADRCPAGSIVGSVSAVSPLLMGKVSGPVYFVRGERKDPKSGRTIRTLPKLYVPLTASDYPGVRIDLHASSDVVDERLVTTFANLPDVPISSFDLKIDGGKNGILVVSNTDMCQSTQYSDNTFTAQSNKRYSAKMGIATACPLAVVKSSRSGGALNLTIGGLAPGKVTVTGKGLAKKAKTIPIAKPTGDNDNATISATTHTSVAVSLSRSVRRALAAGRNVKVKVTVAFKAQGTKTTVKTTKTITIHATKKK